MRFKYSSIKGLFKLMYFLFNNKKSIFCRVIKSHNFAKSFTKNTPNVTEKVKTSCSFKLIDKKLYVLRIINNSERSLIE